MHIAGGGLKRHRELRKRRTIIESNYSVIMFDLGGVLIDCGPFSKMVGWANWTNEPSELETRWLDSAAMTEYQSGNISTKEFIPKIVDELDLAVNTARFIKEFRLIPKGFYPGAEIVLKKLRKKYVTVCLSNTNELHWNKMCSVNKLEEQFTRCFPSHQLHMLKPDKEIYSYVIGQLNVKPSQIVFFDDRGENIETAKELGINAIKTEGLEDVCSELNKLGIM